jgi:hypothetical protein
LWVICDRAPTARVQRPFLFKERLIYEQSTARGVHEMGQNRASIWSRQPLKNGQLHCDSRGQLIA